MNVSTTHNAVVDQATSSGNESCTATVRPTFNSENTECVLAADELPGSDEEETDDESEKGHDGKALPDTIEGLQKEMASNNSIIAKMDALMVPGPESFELSARCKKQNEVIQKRIARLKARQEGGVKRARPT